MKIALTGGAGYLGGYLNAALTAAGHWVCTQDRHGSPESVFDLSDAGPVRAWLASEEPDLVVHMAARTGRLFGEDDQRDSVRSNAEATVNLATTCGRMGVRMVYASSSEIYGDTGSLCREETSITEPTLPHNIYGLSKRWGEEACQLYAPDGLTIWRISMPYGPGAKVGARGLNALHAFLYRAHHGIEIPVHRGASRSWTWVGDTMSGMVATLERPGVWNIGGDHDHRPMLEVAELACDIAGAPRSLIEVVEPPAAQTVVKRISSAKLESLGWVPSMPLEDGMKLTYEWVRQHDRDGHRIGANA